jgi:Lrp/AsnC family transcriptional regulator, leucine-responsive regulatory protein
MHELDLTDKKILRLLQENALITTKELAAKLHLTPTPVYERIKRMEREGYIQKYVAILDKKKMKKGLVVFCNVTLRQHARQIGEKFVKDIVALPEVMECYNVSGEYDFMLKVMVEDMEEYQKFIMNKLASIENIGSTHSLFVMGEIKISTALPI